MLPASNSVNILSSLLTMLEGLLVEKNKALTTTASQVWQARTLPVLLILVLIVLTMLQLAPLPPFIWTALPARETVLSGYALLGLKPPGCPFP